MPVFCPDCGAITMPKKEQAGFSLAFVIECSCGYAERGERGVILAEKESLTS